jgi:hypothetical protein
MSLRQKISCKGTFKEVSAGVVRDRPGNVENNPRTAIKGLSGVVRGHQVSHRKENPIFRIAQNSSFMKLREILHNLFRGIRRNFLVIPMEVQKT